MGPFTDRRCPMKGVRATEKRQSQGTVLRDARGSECQRRTPEGLHRRRSALGDGICGPGVGIRLQGLPRHQTGGLKPQAFASPRPGGWKPKMKGAAGRASSKAPLLAWLVDGRPHLVFSVQTALVSPVFKCSLPIRTPVILD